MTGVLLPGTGYDTNHYTWPVKGRASIGGGGYTFGALKGLTTVGEAEIISSNGERIWFHQHSSQMKDFGEVPEIEELEADNCKLLKEHMNFAAKRASNELIKDIQTGLNQK